MAVGGRRGQVLVAFVDELVELVASVGEATRLRELPCMACVVDQRQRGKSRVAIISFSKVAMCMLFEGFTSS